ncbi:hypothetical protein JCGZ_27060 [Jatropha curcas]|uniref:FCP1 homology domain-containing protein n=1 Tax=Jatropha curcas TaxID=180498 RepID=A0A067L3R7_JATCU|nr:hypothetical protein JCGZ_27060 [Jatropha curcas]
MDESIVDLKQKKNLNNALEFVMGSSKSKLLFAWDQKYCTDSGFKTSNDRHKPIFFKEMENLWDKYSGKYSSSNTLLIDDEPYKSLLNPPNSAIFIPEYNSKQANDNVLGPNGKLRLFLDGITEADDVPYYVKENPLDFGLSAISTDHPEWNYYCKIIRRFGKK